MAQDRGVSSRSPVGSQSRAVLVGIAIVVSVSAVAVLLLNRSEPVAAHSKPLAPADDSAAMVLAAGAGAKTEARQSNAKRGAGFYGAPVGTQMTFRYVTRAMHQLTPATQPPDARKKPAAPQTQHVGFDATLRVIVVARDNDDLITAFDFDAIKARIPGKKRLS